MDRRDRQSLFLYKRLGQRILHNPDAAITILRLHEPGRLYRRTEGRVRLDRHDPAFDFGALFRQARYSMRMKTVVVSCKCM